MLEQKGLEAMLSSITELDPVVLGAICVVGLVVGYSLVFSSNDDGKSLKKEKYQRYKLIKKEKLTHNTRKFTWELATPTTKLGLPVGGHVLISIPGLQDERPYTPVTSEDDLGHFSCIIKIYPDGKLTPKLDALNIGDYINARGPLGTIRYPTPGTFVRKIGKKAPVQVKCKQVNMICGGTGITPMLQLANQMMKDSENIKMAMINANVSADDRLCFQLLEEMRAEATKGGKELSVFYTLDKAPENWDGGVGYVTGDMISANLFPPGEDTMTCLCGPPPMVRGCKRSLEALGFEKSRVWGF